MSEWQGIETAPRTGESLILSSDGWITVGSWNKHRNAWCASAETYPPYPHDEQPTHWLMKTSELPSPPEDS